MNSKTITGTVHSEKGFYIGDICYMLPQKYYDIWCQEDCQDGIYDIKDKKARFAVGVTKYGDGTYFGDNGYGFPVDAGNIGIIPLELVEGNYNEANLFGFIAKCHGDASFSVSDGYFEIELPDGSSFDIDTEYNDEENEFCENEDSCDEDYLDGENL